MGKKKGRFVWYALRSGVLEDVVEAGIPADAAEPRLLPGSNSHPPPAATIQAKGENC